MDRKFGSSLKKKIMPDYLVVLEDVKYGSEVILHCSGGQVAEATQTDKVNGVVTVIRKDEVIPEMNESVPGCYVNEIIPDCEGETCLMNEMWGEGTQRMQIICCSKVKGNDGV